MKVTEEMLAPVRRRFADADGALPVHSLNDLYNEAVHGILPIFDPRLSEAYWQQHVRQHGFKPSGGQIFSETEEWKRFGSEADGDEFVLVLAYVSRAPVLIDRYDWFALHHIYEGVRRSSVAMVAMELVPHPNATTGLKAIVRRWWDSHLADPSRLILSARLTAESNMVEYQSQLAQFGTCWTGSKNYPCEAFYPMDATQAALDRLALDPPRLWALSDESKGIRPIIVLLSANSD